MHHNANPVQNPVLLRNLSSGLSFGSSDGKEDEGGIGTQGGTSTVDVAAKAGTTVRQRKPQEKKNAEAAASASAALRTPQEIGNGKNIVFPRTHQDMIDFIDDFVKGMESTNNRCDKLTETAEKLIDTHCAVLQSTNRHNSPQTSPSLLRIKQKREVREDEENIMTLKKKRKQMKDDKEPKEEIAIVDARIAEYEREVINLEAQYFRKEVAKKPSEEPDMNC